MGASEAPADTGNALLLHEADGECGIRGAHIRQAVHDIRPSEDEEAGDMNAPMKAVDMNFNANIVYAHEHDFRDRDLADNVKNKKSVFKYLDGSQTEIAWQFKDRYLNE